MLFHYIRTALAKRVNEELQHRDLGRTSLYIVEFPKSGGSWLTRMMHDLQSADGSDSSPIVHSHWNYQPNFTPCVYVLRDGRDVVVSLYFHHVRHLHNGTPFIATQIHEYFRDIFGPAFDPDDAKRNLPNFIDSLASHPHGALLRARREKRFASWPTHTRDWANRQDVLIVRYEDMLKDSVAELTGVAEHLGYRLSQPIIADIVSRHSFEAVSGRKPGVEDATSFHRKGIAGDWKNHFTAQSGEAFLRYGGDALIATGYEETLEWPAGLAAD